MKHIKTFEQFINEAESSGISLITESVLDDIEVFKRKFGKKKSILSNEPWAESLQNDLELLASTKGKTKIWKVYESDDYGREVRLLGLFNGVSDQHARLKASIIFNNVEIYATGFYDADEISTGALKLKIKEAEEALDKLKNIQ